MATVSQALKARVETKLRECIAVAEKHYNITIKFPTIKYDLRGTTAGTASPYQWEIDINAALFLENVEEFMISTVPHEMAHLIDYQLHPHNFQRTYFKQKRTVHGPTWKSIMRVLGADPNRCHTYDVSTVAKKTTKHVYECRTCKEIMELGPKRHTKHQGAAILGMRGYYMRGCAHHAGYEYKGLKGARAPVMAVAAQGQKQDKKVAPAGKTKKVQAAAIYAANKHLSRQQIIQLFIDQLGMSKAGAGTYYQMVKG